MSKIKRAVTIGLATLSIGAMSVGAFAAGGNGLGGNGNGSSNAEVAASVTGRTVEDLNQERQQTGKTYGKIAIDSGKSEEFKAQKLEKMKLRLNERVAAGSMTQEQADQIIKNIEERSANCDGTGANSGGGMGRGGMRGGSGMGNGVCDGSCQ